MSSGKGNSTLICQDPRVSGHYDLWHSGNPLDSPVSLFFLQWSLIGIVSQCVDLCLKPLGQSSIVSQMLGGVIFGPSLLGRWNMLSNSLFPPKSSMTLETLAAFGVMFFFFIVGVKMDPATLLRTEKKAISIGLSVFLFPLAIPALLSILMITFVSMDPSLARSLPYIAASQSATAFVVISILLTELKVLNTDIGRLSMSAAMFADVAGFAFTAITFAVLQNEDGRIVKLVTIVLSAAGLLAIIVFVVRPVIIWILKKSGEGTHINEFLIICVFVFVLISGFISEIIGQHYVMGPLLLGLAIPEGPPLGTALINKMETLCYGFFYPTYLVVSGLQTNLFKVDIKSMWIVCLIVAVSFMMKIVAVMVPGYYLNMPLKECFVIGLILNVRGIAELVIYNLWKGTKLLSDQEFSLTVFSIIVVNAIITPVIRQFFNHSKQYYSMIRSSIQHSKRKSELRIMVCIHKDENIPAIINLLEASCASEESNVGVIALVLEELQGRARPLLVAHQPHDTLRSTSCDSTPIRNALNQYEQYNQGCATVQSFTSTSYFETMHDDVCRIALDRRANILVMPFHKQWEIDGNVSISNTTIQNMNIKVLQRAPCSVGILVDRGNSLGGSTSLLFARQAYYVALFFIGDADDAEALAYVSRMSRHECVHVTVVRFLQFGSENSIERRRESDLINEYRHINSRNPKFKIIEEVVRDGIEMSSIMRKLIDSFDLVMVGREHSESALLHGHEEWSECPELGVVGDMLASQDFVTKALVLVVQQQRITHKLVDHNVSKMPNKRDNKVHDDPFEEV